MEEICQNLFGNSTGPVPTLEESQTTISSMSSGKACLLAAIWDYAGTGNDLPDLANIYTSILYNADNYGDYNYLKTLTNTAATHDNIYQWLTWLCAEYGTVDVYLYGHGTILTVSGITTYAYCTYDGLNADLTWNEPKFFYANELKSNVGPNYYDYSSLRLGLGGFCYSGHFSSVFINEGKVWIGPTAVVTTTYDLNYTSCWGYNWYALNVISYTAHLYAYNNASSHTGGYSVFTYYSSSSAFYH
jgi:hypothetical protein